MVEKNAMTKPITHYNRGQIVEMEDSVAIEYPLTIVLNGEEFATIVCTPSDLKDMVIGFLASEGAILQMEHIRSLSVNEREGYAYVEITSAVPAPKDYMKRFIGSCCGKSRHFYYKNDAKTAKTMTTSLNISAEDCFTFMHLLQEQSFAFKSTGGVHNAALCSTDGIVVARTDIGRHNALDKIYGYCLRHRLSLADKFIAFSGRLSSEVLIKTAKIGVGILLSKSAATQLAIELAEELNITMVGFIRRDRFNIYSHPERIQVGQYETTSV